VSTYDPSAASIVLERISEGDSVNKACKEAGVKSRVVYAWRMDNEPNGTGEFKIAYEMACKERDQHYLDLADQLMVEAREICDTPEVKVVGDDGKVRTEPREVRWAQLQVDTRMKQAARYNPRKYGDRQTVQHAGHDGGPLSVPEGATRETLLAEMRRLTAELKQSGIDLPGLTSEQPAAGVTVQ
jgi:hypothetical protein